MKNRIWVVNIKSKRKNLSSNIRNLLSEKITRGEYVSGTLLASNKELAEEFGVSILTADRAVVLSENSSAW